MLSSLFKKSPTPEQERELANLQAQRIQYLEKYTENWVWRSVSALIDGEDEYTIDYFLSRLNTTEAEIVEALKVLEFLGIVRKTKKGYKKILSFVQFSDQSLDAAKIIKSHQSITQFILNEIATQPRETIFYRTSFIGTTEKKFREFTAKYEKLTKDFLMESAQIKPEKIYALSLSAVEVTGAKGDVHETI